MSEGAYNANYRWTQVWVGAKEYVLAEEAKREVGYEKANTEGARICLKQAQLETKAFEAAATTLATRAVHAEAAAATLRLELDAVKQQHEETKAELANANGRYKALWCEFWHRQGFTREEIRAGLRATLKLSEEEAFNWTAEGRSSGTYELDKAGHSYSADFAKWNHRWEK